MDDNAKLILVRGIPGSGKSTIAKQLAIALRANHFEADMYFERDGVYQFDVTNLGAAHFWCQRETKSSLYYGTNTIVSNTFTTIKELKPYFEIATEFGIVPTVIVAQNQFTNVHNVPDDKLQQMRNRFVYDISTLFNTKD